MKVQRLKRSRLQGNWEELDKSEQKWELLEE